MARKKVIDDVKPYFKLINHLISYEYDSVDNILQLLNINIETLNKMIAIVNSLGYSPYLPNNLCQCWIENEIVYFKLPQTIYSSKEYLQKYAAQNIELFSKGLEIQLLDDVKKNVEISTLEESKLIDIEKAISNKRQITFEYNNKERIVFPQSIFLANGNYYINCLDINVDEKRIYKVNNVNNLKISLPFRQSEILPEGFSFVGGETIIVLVDNEFFDLVKNYPHSVELDNQQFKISAIKPKAFCKLYFRCHTKLKIIESSNDFIKECISILSV